MACKHSKSNSLCMDCVYEANKTKQEAHDKQKAKEKKDK